MIITFCGHSDYFSNIEDEKRMLDTIAKIAPNAPLELYLGGYGGFDKFALRCGQIYKQTHPSVKLILITPYLTIEHQRNLELEKHQYDLIVYPELEHIPPRFAIVHRNRWMVDRADAVIAYVNRKWGGAYQTYHYAEQRGKKIFNLATT